MSKYAFPTEPRGPVHGNYYDGLTKREYAAIHLLPSVILADDFEAPVEVLAKRAVALADAVLREAGE